MYDTKRQVNALSRFIVNDSCKMRMYKTYILKFPTIVLLFSTIAVNMRR